MSIHSRSLMCKSGLPATLVHCKHAGVAGLRFYAPRSEARRVFWCAAHYGRRVRVRSTKGLNVICAKSSEEQSERTGPRRVCLAHWLRLNSSSTTLQVMRVTRSLLPRRTCDNFSHKGTVCIRPHGPGPLQCECGRSVEVSTAW